MERTLYDGDALPTVEVAAEALGVMPGDLFFFRFDEAGGVWRGVTRSGRKLCSATPSPLPEPETPAPAVEDKPQAKPGARKAKS